jgi:hypothetical protein
VSEMPSPSSCRNSVELQIERVIVASLEQATVNVRCLRGPVRRGPASTSSEVQHKRST